MKKMKFGNKKTLVLLSMISLIIPSLMVSNANAIPAEPEIGITWREDYIVLGDCYLTKEDAQGLRNELHRDHWKQGFEQGDWECDFRYWQYQRDSWSEGVDSVHFGYYAGHGSITTLIFRWLTNVVNVNTNCNWGDENSNKLNWVGLACCLTGDSDVGAIADAMEGVHLVGAWETECDEGIYGETMGEELINNHDSFKTAWFDAGEEWEWHGSGHERKMIVWGENNDMGDDHVYYCGTPVHSDPTVDSTKTFWTQRP